MAEGRSAGVYWFEYHGRGYWSRDGLLPLWLSMVVDELDKTPCLPLTELRENWRAQVRIVFDGVTSCKLDPLIVTNQQRHALEALCQALEDRLTDENLSPGPLARHIGGTRWQSESTVGRLACLAEATSYLLAQAGNE